MPEIRKLTSSANGLSIGKTLSSAIRCKTRGGPTRPPKMDDNAATNNPNINNAPTNEIYSKNM